MTDKQLPYDSDAERATLGSIILNREAIIPIAVFLKAAHFYVEKHAWIYEAVTECYDQSTPPDLRTVADALRRRDRLDAVGGVSYLSDLIDAVPTSYHVEFYARIVERTAMRRAGILAGGTICALFYDERSDLDQAITAAYGALDGATARAATDDGLLPVAATVDAMYEAIAAAMDKGEGPRFGLSTGFRDLDEITGGLQATDLIVLAARPSVGKSSFSLSLAYNVATAGSSVAVFSLEMSREQCVQRLISLDTGINLQQVRLWTMRESELAVYMEALGRVHALPLHIDERMALTVADIRSRALRHMAQDGPIDLVIIDYLQLMAGGKRNDNRVQEVSEITRGLKQLAKELHCPVLALSQLSRAVEGRQSHIPMLSDLRDSGTIEQDSDIVMFIYREELYDKDTDKKGIAEIHIAKHRNGPTGVAPMRFDANTTRFMDLSYRSPEGY
jgi:replicative DNA helicase